MLEFIQHIDETILNLIHIKWANSLLDFVMPFIRNQYFWSPVYLFLLVYMSLNHKKKGLLWCLFFFITFMYCDFISATIIKPMAHRLRPCNEPYLSFTVRELVGCGSGYSFPSSHATNHFGMSFFIIFTLAKNNKTIIFLSLFWASIVCYAQMYVAVHYPFDILCGAFLGIVIAKLNSLYYLKRFKDFTF
jgi:membrane-associated phospholipid phosphatase